MAVNDKFFKNFKEENNKVYFTGKYMEVCIPYYYFEGNMAQIIGDKIETLGIFIIKVYDDVDKKGKSENHIYKFPSLIFTKPSLYYKEKASVNKKIYDFLVLQYYCNDIFIDSTIVVQSGSFANDFISFYHNGKIPTFIDYNDLYQIELETTFVNKMKFPVAGTILEGIVSEICRDPDDLNNSFRFKAADGANLKDYVPISITEIPTYTSTFTSMTFQDIDYQMITSVNKTRYNRDEKMSPLEETIKY